MKAILKPLGLLTIGQALCISTGALAATTSELSGSPKSQAQALSPQSAAAASQSVEPAQKATAIKNTAKSSKADNALAKPNLKLKTKEKDIKETNASATKIESKHASKTSKADSKNAAKNESKKETKPEEKLVSTLESAPMLSPLPVSEELLFEAKVAAPAPIDGPEDHPKLIQEAFKHMLIRASGSEKILGHATVVKALSEVDNYVSQFGIQMNANQERVLNVKFDENLCRELLKNAGQPVLTVAKRPPVVLWLAMQEGQSIQWLSRDTQNELSQQLELLANRRGLSLVYPLLDLTDTSLVSEQAVWNEDLTTLQEASKRYNAEHMLIGKLSKQPSGWYAQWTYVKQGNSIRWDMSNTELASVFGEALDEFSNRLSSSPSLAAKKTDKTKTQAFGQTNSDAVAVASANASAGAGANAGVAVEAAGTDASIGSSSSSSSNSSSNSSASSSSDASIQNQTLRLVVAGVSGSEQYTQVLKYLQSLPAVQGVEVAEISPDQTIFKLNTTASREAIIDSIAVGQLLKEQPKENTENKENQAQDSGNEVQGTTDIYVKLSQTM